MYALKSSCCSCWYHIWSVKLQNNKQCAEIIRSTLAYFKAQPKVLQIILCRFGPFSDIYKRQSSRIISKTVVIIWYLRYRCKEKVQNADRICQAIISERRQNAACKQLTPFKHGRIIELDKSGIYSRKISTALGPIHHKST